MEKEVVVAVELDSDWLHSERRAKSNLDGDLLTCHIFSMFDELKRRGKDLELILITNVNPKKFSFPPLFAESNSNITVTG